MSKVIQGNFLLICWMGLALMLLSHPYTYIHYTPTLTYLHPYTYIVAGHVHVRYIHVHVCTLTNKVGSPHVRMDSHQINAICLTKNLLCDVGPSSRCINAQLTTWPARPCGTVLILRDLFAKLTLFV